MMYNPLCCGWRHLYSGSVSSNETPLLYAGHEKLSRREVLLKKNAREKAHRIFIAAVSLMLSASLLAGCGQTTGSGSDPAAQAAETAQKAQDGAQQLIHWIAETFGLNRSAEETSGTSDITASSSVTESSSDTGPSQSIYFSLLPEEMDERYQDKLPEGSSLFVNNASFYYYYSVLTSEQQQLYDAFFAVLQQPDSKEYRKRVNVAESPDSDAFRTNIDYAYKALIFDHPELFWFSQNGGVFSYYYSGQQQSDGTYAVMVQLAETYDNYQTEMTTFNQAVDSFMSQIDLSQSQPMIAMQIHDRLIDMVTYDDALADATTAAGDVTDYGYTAYGALVANSRGEANTAVCDGYSFAFEYLCQQAGITAMRITGQAGSSPDQMGGHSWNLVQYDDGQWYEVDATWDDREPVFDENDPAAQIYHDAMNDTVYWGRIRHYLFNVTTQTISDFQPDDRYTYYEPDGSYATFLGESFHIRDDGSDASTGDPLTCLAPTAEGTQYSYDNLMGY